MTPSPRRRLWPLTFKPPPGEFQIYLKLPPAQAVLGSGGQSAGNDENKDPKDIKPQVQCEPPPPDVNPPEPPSGAVGACIRACRRLFGDAALAACIAVCFVVVGPGH